MRGRKVVQMRSVHDVARYNKVRFGELESAEDGLTSTFRHQQSGRKITDISGPAGKVYRFLRVMKPYMVTPETGGRL
jgi:uncharacterized linocin/CFP29 family protein